MTEQETGFIQLEGFATAQEPQHVPEAAYTLRIVRVNYTKKSKKTQEDMPRISIILDIADEEYANSKSIQHTLWLPKPDDDAKRRESTTARVRKFIEHFGVDYSEKGFELADLIGKEAPCYLEIEDTDKGTFNRIQTLLSE